MKRLVACLIAACTATAMPAASAADLPRKSAADARVRYVTYSPDDVVVVNVRRGVVTRIVLEAGERIVQSGTGFAASCERDELEWCIRADRDTSQVWVKPRTGATHNNLELATSLRDYSIRFHVLPDGTTAPKARNADEMYRVIFQYPVRPLPVPAALLADPADEGAMAAGPPLEEAATVAARLAARPVARNGRYSMQVLGGGALVAPALVFDDGRFTYFRFPNNREVPAPFVVGADGGETRVNFHVDGDLMVIHRVAPRFVLRLGDAVVGIWNDAYDPDGVAAPRGVVVPDVVRAVK